MLRARPILPTNRDVVRGEVPDAENESGVLNRNIGVEHAPVVPVPLDSLENLLRHLVASLPVNMSINGTIRTARAGPPRVRSRSGEDMEPEGENA